eukprot:1368900-Alexandrium_andersonii.AAC.1
MSSAFRSPGRRPHARARPLVAKSESSIRTATSGGVAANIASSFQKAMSSATYRLRTFGLSESPLLWSTHRPPI